MTSQLKKPISFLMPDPEESVPSVLRRLAAHLIQHPEEWNQGGKMAFSIYGTPRSSEPTTKEPPIASCCTLGWMVRLVLSLDHGRCLSHLPLMDIAKRYLPIDFDATVHSLGDWNDEPGRTVEEVAALFNHIADEYARSHGQS